MHVMIILRIFSTIQNRI